MERVGAHVVPYTNARLFDATNPASRGVWEKDGATRFSCKRHRGGAYTENYEPQQHNWSFMVMDPATDYWQKKVSAVAGRIATTYNTSGIYMDQIALMYAEPCF